MPRKTPLKGFGMAAFESLAGLRVLEAFGGTPCDDPPRIYSPSQCRVGLKA